MNDQNLVTRIHNQDSAAEKEFVQIFYGKIEMIVSMRVNNSEDVKELINDILIAAVFKIRNGDFDAEKGSGLTHYIYGITRNKLNYYFKKLYKKRERDEKYRKEFEDDKYYAFVETFEFEKREEIEQNKKIWRKLIEQLKPKYREIIYLRYYDDLPVSEIGKKLNIPSQKVSNYLKYARQLLMQSIKK